MPGVNKKYRISMEVITPLHVGAASDKHYKKGLDYYYDRDKKEVVFINHQLLASKKGDSFVQYLANADYASIQNLVRGNSSFALKRIKLNNDPGGDIKAHIRNGLDGRPIVPGSSIKGALRSVLFKHLRGPNENTNEAVFGSMRQNNDFMRFIRVGDAQFGKTALATGKIFNLLNENREWKGGWKHGFRGPTDTKFKTIGFTTTYEVIPIGATTEFELMLAHELFRLAERPFLANQHNLNAKRRIVSDVDNLFEIVNNHTREYIRQEIAFFERFHQASRSETILDNLNDYIIPILEEENSCLLRMSSGSGFHAITGNWKFENHTSTIDNPLHAKRYKSRRIAFEIDDDGRTSLLPMGFVLLTKISEH